MKGGVLLCFFMIFLILFSFSVDSKGGGGCTCAPGVYGVNVDISGIPATATTGTKTPIDLTVEYLGGVGCSGSYVVWEDNCSGTFERIPTDDTDLDCTGVACRKIDPVEGTWYTKNISWVSAGDYWIAGKWMCDGVGFSPVYTSSENTLVSNPVNEKDESMFYDNGVFLISDDDWRVVFSFVPAVIWTETNGDITKYPYMVYHQEEDGFDIDSTVHFMQLYAPNNVSIIGNYSSELYDVLVSDNGVSQETIQQDPNSYFGPGLESSQIHNISMSDYFSYWNNYENITLVDYDNYEDGAMASVFASYHNMPLLFVDEFNLGDYEDYIEGKDVYLVGSVDSNVSSFVDDSATLKGSYTSDELLSYYTNNVNPDNLILVNSDDMENSLTEDFPTEKADENVTSLFGNHFLSAPILAASRNDVIIDASEDDIDWSPMEYGCSPNGTFLEDNVALIDNFVVDKVNGVLENHSFNHLTIIASPLAIPDSVYKSCYGGDEAYRYQKDTFYGVNPDSVFGGYPPYSFQENILEIDNNSDLSYVFFRSNVDPANETYFSKLNKTTEKIVLDTIPIGFEDVTSIRNFDVELDSGGNVHLVQSHTVNLSIGKVVYSKIDSTTGDMFFGMVPIWNTSIFYYGVSPKVKIDSKGDAHVVWKDKPSGASYPEIYYSKINGTDGAILINATIISSNDNKESTLPGLALDSQDNVHVVWKDDKYSIYSHIFYSKLNGTTGETLIDDTDISSVCGGEMTPFSAPLIEIDGSEDLHIAWNCDVSAYDTDRVYYSKLDSTDGSTLIDDTLVSGAEEAKDVSIGVDSSFDVHFMWTNASDSNLGELIYSKINGSNGSVLVNITVSSIDDGFNSISSSIKLDSQDNLYVSWGDEFDGGFLKLYYGYLDENYELSDLQELVSASWAFSTGRIYGITVSDASSYIARSLFYDYLTGEIYEPNQFTGMAIASSYSSCNINAQNIMNKTNSSGYNSSCYTCDMYSSNPCNPSGCYGGCYCQTGPNASDFNEYYKEQFLSFADHGASNSWGGTLVTYPDQSDYMPLFDLPYSYAMACSTSNFWQQDEKYTFSSMFLRRGGIGYHGAHGVSSRDDCEEVAIKTITTYTNLSMGALNFILLDSAGCSYYDDYFSLLGDPSLIPIAGEVEWE